MTGIDYFLFFGILISFWLIHVDEIDELSHIKHKKGTYEYAKKRNEVWCRVIGYLFFAVLAFIFWEQIISFYGFVLGYIWNDKVSTLLCVLVFSVIGIPVFSGISLILIILSMVIVWLVPMIIMYGLSSIVAGIINHFFLRKKK